MFFYHETNALKLIRDRGAWKVIVSYGKEQST